MLGHRPSAGGHDRLRPTWWANCVISRQFFCVARPAPPAKPAAARRGIPPQGQRAAVGPGFGSRARQTIPAHHIRQPLRGTRLPVLRGHSAEHHRAACQLAGRSMPATAAKACCSEQAMRPRPDNLLAVFCHTNSPARPRTGAQSLRPPARHPPAAPGGQALPAGAARRQSSISPTASTSGQRRRGAAPQKSEIIVPSPPHPRICLAVAPHASLL